MSVGEVCQRQVATARASDTIRAAAQRMDSEDVGSLVVVDDDGRPVAMLTDRDIATRVVRRRLSPDSTLVEQVMSPDVLSVRESSRLPMALGRLRTEGFRRAPVVDSKGFLVGVFAVDDALAYVARDLSAVSQVVGAQRSLATT